MKISIQIGRSETRGEIGFYPPLDPATVREIPDVPGSGRSRILVAMLQSRWGYGSDPIEWTQGGVPYTSFGFLIDDSPERKSRSEETDLIDLEGARILGKALEGVGYEIEIDPVIKEITGKKDGELFQDFLSSQ